MTKIPTVRERYEEKFGWAGSPGTFTGIRDEEIVKFITAEREAGAREEKQRHQDAIAALLVKFHPCKTGQSDDFKMGGYKAMETLADLLTPPTK